MTEENLISLYEIIRKSVGSNFIYDDCEYVIQREVNGVVITIEPPQEKLGPGEYTTALLTLPFFGRTPEELKSCLDVLIAKRDALQKKTYVGTLKDYDDGIEYVYEIPTADESKLVMIIKDFNNI